MSDDEGFPSLARDVDTASVVFSSSTGGGQLIAPFMLLGAPRSGTNYLSSLVKAHPDVELQIEPFALHTRSFLAEDLEPAGYAADALAGALSHPLVESLIAWLARGNRGYKETILFEKLPLLATRLPRLKVVFIARDVDEIVASHMRNGLAARWRLAERYRHHSDQRIRQYAHRAREDAEPLIRLVTEMRIGLWREYRSLFDHIEVSYPELATRPAMVLDRVMAYLGSAVHPFQRLAIRRRSDLGSSSPYGTFSGHRPVELNVPAPNPDERIHQVKMPCLPPLVTAEMAARFLNETGLDPTGHDHYDIYNPFNPDLPLRYRHGTWIVRLEDASRPATGFTALGAERCCAHYGGRLPRVDELMACAEAVGWPARRHFPVLSRHYRMCDSIEKPDSVLGSEASSGGKEQMRRELFGNVGNWCGIEAKGEDRLQRSDSRVVFGAGFNKDDSYLLRRCYRRWARTGSVGVGFRIAGWCGRSAES